MNPGAPKDAVDNIQPAKAEPAVFNAPDLQTAGNRSDLAGKNEALVSQGVMPAIELTGQTAKFEKTQWVDQSTLDADKPKPKGTEVATAAAVDSAPVQSRDTVQPPTEKSTTPGRPADAPSEKPTTPSRPADAPSEKPTTPSRPADAPSEKPTTPSRPADAPSEKPTPPSGPADTTPAKPGERPTDVPVNRSVPADQPAPAPAEAPKDAQATNPQFLENAKVRRGEGPYQVASRLLAADGQPTKQADVKALTEAFKKVYGDQQKADPNLPGLAGLKQNHAFINKDNLKAVTDELKKAGHPELADRLTKDATAKPPEAAPKPGDAPQPKPGDQPPKQFSSQDIANEAINGISSIPKDRPLDHAVDRLGTAINESFKHPELFKPGTNRDSITEELNKGAEKSEDPRIKGKEFYWDQNNKLKLREKAKPAAVRPTARPDTEQLSA